MAELAESLDSDIDALADELADVIHDGLTELDEDLRAMTRASCRANLANIVSLLRDHAPPSSSPVPPEAVVYAHEYAQRGHGVQALLGAYRLAHQRFYDIWLERLRGHARSVEALSEAARFSSEWLFAWMTAVTGVISQAYEAERDNWVRTAAAIRAEAVRLVLSGQTMSAADVSRRLGYDLDGRHVAFVVWAQTGQVEAVPPGGFESVARAVARELGGSSILFVPQGQLRLDGWAHVGAEAETRGLARRLPEAKQAGLRVAVGLPASGAEGFRASHEDAMEAQRISLLSGRSPGACVPFDDVTLLSLLTADPAAAERYVSLELGELIADTDASRRIVATLAAFLDENMSFKRTGRRLGVHENTVAYRVRRAEELLGHDLGERRLQLHAALRAHEVLRRR